MDRDLVCALLSTLVNRLGNHSPEMKYLAAADQKGPYSKLNRWREMLENFLEVINFSVNEKDVLSDVNIKMWLDDVRELTYDVEEILDEIANQSLMTRSQTVTGKKSSLKGLVSACLTRSNTSAVTAFDDSLSSRMTDTSSRLENLDMKRNAFGLKVISVSFIQSRRECAWSVPVWPIQAIQAIHGRDEDKMKIVEMVLRGEPSDHGNFSVIPIIGMSGIGKTTLARHVFDDKVLEHFKPRAWVSVSGNSDVLRISKQILESITSKSCDLKDLNKVLIQPKEAIVGSKFLLVLDDVSTKNYGLWETLMSSFMAGAPGSKIIVTTCSVDIAFPIDLNIQPYTVEVLSDEDCWSVFAMNAFDGEKFVAPQNLKLIREKVFYVCKGLPLAASILGGRLRSVASSQWEYVLNSGIRDLVEDNQILPVLKLSYINLSPQLKRCFAYCAILPKDYEFKEKELVLLWMAEGLFGGPLEHVQIEDRGGKFFQELLKMSLFQRSSSDASKFRMHDLVKNMARWISGETDLRLEDVLGVTEQLRRFKTACHSNTPPSFDGTNEFELYYDVERLRTYLPGLRPNTHYITDVLLADLLPKCKRLRALSLEKQNITELPNSVAVLRYLRYVNLSSTMITRLPDSICSLLMLQILLLRDCSCLEELPSNLRNLINLRHLDISGINLIREMPSEMKELECLRTILNFIVGKGMGSDLKDLKELKFLRELNISRLHNVIGSQDTTDSILIDKKDLRVLVLEWGSQLYVTRDELMEQKVLDKLQPHNLLKELTIKGYRGARFPSWFGVLNRYCLVVLKLESCERCRVLPSLGCLMYLEHLTIKGMTGIKSIGSEIFGKDFPFPFTSLKTLCFEDMQEWEHWDLVEKKDHIPLFPSLHELSLLKCPKLRGKLPKLHHLFYFDKLTIEECGQLVFSFSSLRRSCDAQVDGCKMLCGAGDMSPSLNKGQGASDRWIRKFNWRKTASNFQYLFVCFVIFIFLSTAFLME